MSIPADNTLLFTKMHGIGNDYVYIDCMESLPANLPQLSIEMSDRHRGVGGDGIILICPSEVADFKMRIFNADGSEARMCGNGSRCVGKFVYDKGLTQKDVITLETLAGVRTIKLRFNDMGEVDGATVDMGEPELECKRIPAITSSERMIDGEVQTSRGSVRLTAVSMGNPHGVLWVDDTATADVHGLGSELEFHKMWPERSNIEFARLVSPTEVDMRVWERGSGETMACGTGACATAVAGVLTGRTEREVTIHLPGGDLLIRWDDKDNHVYMTGDAKTVFEGTYKRSSVLSSPTTNE